MWSPYKTRKHTCVCVCNLWSDAVWTRRARRRWWFRRASWINMVNPTAARLRTGRTSMLTTGILHSLLAPTGGPPHCRELSLSELPCSLRESLCYMNSLPGASAPGQQQLRALLPREQSQLFQALRQFNVNMCFSLQRLRCGGLRRRLC